MIGTIISAVSDFHEFWTLKDPGTQKSIEKALTTIKLNKIKETIETQGTEEIQET
jgi:hypothetical protein